MGTFSGYLAAHNFLLNQLGTENWIGSNVSGVEQSSIGKGAVIGNNVVLGANVKIENSIIFPDVHIPNKAIIKNAVVGSSPDESVIDKVYINENEKSIL